MTTKIAVSLPDELVAQARAAVEAGEAASVSAYIAGTMAQAVRRERLEDVLADIAAEFGAPTAEDRAWARQALGLG